LLDEEAGLGSPPMQHAHTHGKWHDGGDATVWVTFVDM
jgi:hypothetical protein